MPDATTTETPARRLMRQWFKSRLTENLLHAGQMAQSRNMLRRGVLKMQDGTLGQPGEPSAMEEEMEINVDSPITVHNHYPSAEAQPSAAAPAAEPPAAAPAKSLIAKAAPYVLTAALAASGVGIPWALTALGGKAAETLVDTDTQYVLDLLPTEGP